MISPATFTKHKCDSESLKKHFDKPSSEYADGPKRLVNIIRTRCQDGRIMNFRDYRIYAAIDMAYDAPFNQVTPTLVRNLIDKNTSYEETLKAVKAWGLTQCNLFCNRTNPLNGKVETVFNAPTFFQVLVPLVKSYVTIRLAKLFNDRNNTPLFKYEALKDTARNRVACEVVTDLMQAMTTQFGYSSDLRNAIFKTLMYSICLQFPREAWYHEKQEQTDGSTKTEREGLRYVQPHPTRMFWDQFYGVSTFNTNSGCEYAGYWSIRRFGELYANKLLWNRDKVGIGTNWFEHSMAGTYFTEVYPCTMSYPAIMPERDTDRETRAYYSGTNDLDKAVFVTEVFQKLVPKDYGLGTYESPVWFRFLMASDDTVMWAEPLAYTPVVYFGYDADDARSRNPSMALEILPWQDHLGNVLSQILLTTKQNLANVVFYDTNIVDKTEVEKLQNSGELLYRGLNLVGFDSFKNNRAGLDAGKAFEPVMLPKMSTGELTNTISTIISILERLLVMSAQEIGSAASHQQSAQEIRTISDNTSTRVAYTGAFIDDAIDAWKRQLYEASLAYMDRKYASQVSTDIPELDKVLDALGMTKKEVSPSKTSVEGTLDKLTLEGFASQRDGPDRGSDTQTATVLMQTVQAVAGNPLLAQSVGVPTILQLLSQAARLGGAPKDFELRASPEAQAQAQQPSAEEILKIVNDQLGKPLVDALTAQKQQTEQAMAQLSQQTADALGQVGQATQQVAAQVGDQQAQLQETQAVLIKLTEQFQTALGALPVPQPAQYDSVPTDPLDGGPVAPPPGMVPQVGAPPL